jgi:hypothetical protein
VLTVADYITILEAAAMMRYSPESIRRAVALGLLNCDRTRRPMRVSVAALQAWAATRRPRK